MKRFRLSRLAEADLEDILATSAEGWGMEGQRRYAAIIAAALLQVVNDPQGPMTRERTDLLSSLRSFHTRHARGDVAAKVRRPVHILFYRAHTPDLIEVVRVLHERMDPSRHLAAITR